MSEKNNELGYVIVIIALFITLLISLFIFMQQMNNNKTLDQCIYNCGCYYDEIKKELTAVDNWMNYRQDDPLEIKTKFYLDINTTKIGELLEGF